MTNYDFLLRKDTLQCLVNLELQVGKFGVISRERNSQNESFKMSEIFKSKNVKK